MTTGPRPRDPAPPPHRTPWWGRALACILLSLTRAPAIERWVRGGLDQAKSGRKR